MVFRREVRLDLPQRVSRGVPVRAIGVPQCVLVQTSRRGEASLGHTGLCEMGPDAMDQLVGFGHGGRENTSKCDLQTGNHTGMLFSVGKPRRMARSADEKRDLLRAFMKERGLKTARWAKESGVSANSIYNFLNDYSDGLDDRTYAKLARTAEVPVWRLSGEQPEPPSPTTIWVSGHVEAGSFREAVEWDRSLWYSVDVPVPSRFRGKAKALEPRGTSMNLVYPPGSVVMWVDVLDYRPPRDGDRVVVYAYRSDGMIEATVKELRVDGTDRWLWPRSNDPLHQVPINAIAPGDEYTSIEIKGIVIGSYRAEVY